MTILDWLDASAAKVPEKTALLDDKTRLSYAGLQAAAQSVGTALIEQLGTRNAPVAVLIDRNVESLCAFLGVVASGNFYVPLSKEQLLLFKKNRNFYQIKQKI